jgi:hypothetical protein
VNGHRRAARLALVEVSRPVVRRLAVRAHEHLLVLDDTAFPRARALAWVDLTRTSPTFAYLVLLIQGLADRVCPPEQSELKRADRAGPAVDYLTLADEGHGFTKADSDHSLTRDRSRLQADSNHRHRSVKCGSRDHATTHPYLGGRHVRVVLDALPIAQQSENLGGDLLRTVLFGKDQMGCKPSVLIAHDPKADEVHAVKVPIVTSTLGVAT